MTTAIWCLPRENMFNDKLDMNSFPKQRRCCSFLMFFEVYPRKCKSTHRWQVPVRTQAYEKAGQARVEVKLLIIFYVPSNHDSASSSVRVFWQLLWLFIKFLDKFTIVKRLKIAYLINVRARLFPEFMKFMEIGGSGPTGEPRLFSENKSFEKL